ncbi:hypothetical protein [Luteibacter sp.]|jgi:hypothetical protein|uniref:hypothetical protein n=1 Tax=Luteibacter sp. TaxID=1886636 RepID=UPI002F4294C9
MRATRIIILALASSLTACASAPPAKRGSVADADPLRRAMVADIVSGLSEVYEPTATVLVPSRLMSGAFDTALLAALRARGFTVGDAHATGDRFDSRVELLEGNMYCVTARVDKTTLSRLWVLDGANAYPGGAWTRLE